MAPHPLTPSNWSSISGDSNSVKVSSSPFSDTITTSIFGIFALAVGVITIWQGHRAWKLFHAVRDNHAYELEAIALDREEQVNDANDDGSSLDLSLDPLSTTTSALNNDSRALDTGDADTS
ncbi:hypothetical protein G7Y79_00002g004990 [Physcia stellaris]|nr:hypothetical protein G7Y79_00002g004990 [Physcia stellaris]